MFNLSQFITTGNARNNNYTNKIGSENNKPKKIYTKSHSFTVDCKQTTCNMVIVNLKWIKPNIDDHCK